jgi:hypothetical protein
VGANGCCSVVECPLRPSAASWDHPAEASPRAASCGARRASQQNVSALSVLHRASVLSYHTTVELQLLFGMCSRSPVGLRSRSVLDVPALFAALEQAQGLTLHSTQLRKPVCPSHCPRGGTSHARRRLSWRGLSHHGPRAAQAAVTFASTTNNSWYRCACLAVHRLNEWQQET